MFSCPNKAYRISKKVDLPFAPVPQRINDFSNFSVLVLMKMMTKMLVKEEKLEKPKNLEKQENPKNLERVNPEK